MKSGLILKLLPQNIMIEKTNFITIGAAGRNVGKTEFACELIANYTKKENVIGVKITTINEKNEKCPRGVDGCGVCSSLKGNYCITEEITGQKGKDTVRMLTAGAEKVYWLRVLREHLKEGIEDLLKLIPDNACVVCESNSSRQILKPGIFIVIKDNNVDKVKLSCKNVIHLADKIIKFKNNNWDFQPENFYFENKTWSFKNV